MTIFAFETKTPWTELTSSQFASESGDTDGVGHPDADDEADDDDDDDDGFFGHVLEGNFKVKIVDDGNKRKLATR